MDKDLDRQSYTNWQINEYAHPKIEQTSDWKKFIISSYLYARSRLGVPGRNYADNEHNVLPIGGLMHCELIDLDIWLQKKGDAALHREVMDWINGASLEEAAYYRGFGKSSRSTIMRRRNKIANRIADDSNKSTE